MIMGHDRIRSGTRSSAHLIAACTGALAVAACFAIAYALGAGAI
jgi:hypothetical protein